MMEIKARYLGYSVIVSAELVRLKEQAYPLDKYGFPTARKSVRWVRSPIDNLMGMITGITTKYDGYIIPGSGYDEDAIPRYLRITKSHRCYLVRFGAVNKERVIPADALEPIGREILPYRTYGVTWDEATRKIMREDAARQSRDSRGRFVKAPPK